jgi:isopentenyl phosphate kinase
VITRKDRLLTLNLRAIKRLACEISQARVFRLVHGVVSYGHSLAEQYRIQEGYKDSSQVIGFAKTHQAMVTLDKLIGDVLIDEGVSVVAIPPSACIEGGKTIA